MYRVHNVTIQGNDYGKADDIIRNHIKAGDIDKVYAMCDYGKQTKTYCIYPYIYEDFEALVNEFKQNGIPVL